MGDEYIIRLRESDLKSIEKQRRGPNSIVQLLREVPCYRGMSADGVIFFYSIDEARDSQWRSYVVVKGDRLCLCSYAREDYQCIVQFLLSGLMKICGHFEIEDA